MTTIDHLIRRKELKAIVGISATTAWRLEKEGKFPRRRRISKGAVGWLVSEIQEWLRSRKAV